MLVLFLSKPEHAKPTPRPALAQPPARPRSRPCQTRPHFPNRWASLKRGRRCTNCCDAYVLFDLCMHMALLSAPCAPSRLTGAAWWIATLRSLPLAALRSASLRSAPRAGARSAPLAGLSPLAARALAGALGCRRGGSRGFARRPRCSFGGKPFAARPRLAALRWRGGLRQGEKLPTRILAAAAACLKLPHHFSRD